MFSSINRAVCERKGEPKQSDVEPFISARMRGDEHSHDQPSGKTIRYPEGTTWRVGAGVSVVFLLANQCPS